MAPLRWRAPLLGFKEFGGREGGAEPAAFADAARAGFNPCGNGGTGRGVAATEAFAAVGSRLRSRWMICTGDLRGLHAAR
jgi:hypothetical protein